MTKGQGEALRAIAAHWREHRYHPTFREVSEAMKMPMSTLVSRVRYLRAQGLLEPGGHRNGLGLTATGWSAVGSEP